MPRSGRKVLVKGFPAYKGLIIKIYFKMCEDACMSSLMMTLNNATNIETGVVVVCLFVFLSVFFFFFFGGGGGGGI